MEIKEYIWEKLLQEGRYEEALEMLDCMAETEKDGLDCKHMRSHNRNYDLTPAVVMKEEKGRLTFFETWRPWEYDEEDIVYVATCYEDGESPFIDGAEEALSLKEKIVNNENLPENFKKELTRRLVLDENALRKAIELEKSQEVVELDSDQWEEMEEERVDAVCAGMDFIYYHLLNALL